MAKRYYLATVIVDVDPVEGGPRVRAKTAFYAISQSAVIPSGPDGMPLFNWALVVVNGVNHAPLLADSQIDALPDVPLDVKVNAITTSVRQDMSAALARRGIAAAVITQADGYRDVIRGLGRVLQADFNENGLDVAAGG